MNIYTGIIAGQDNKKMINWLIKLLGGYTKAEMMSARRYIIKLKKIRWIY